MTISKSFLSLRNYLLMFVEIVLQNNPKICNKRFQQSADAIYILLDVIIYDIVSLTLFLNEKLKKNVKTFLLKKHFI